VKGGLLLDVVIGKSTSILELLSSENKTLLIRWDTFLILNLGLYVVDGVRWLYIQSDGLSSKGLYKNLHTSTKTKYQVKGGLLLDVVIGKSTSILELLSSENKTLLIRWDTFLILNLGLYVVDGVRWLYIQSDGLSSESFNENLLKEGTMRMAKLEIKQEVIFQS